MVAIIILVTTPGRDGQKEVVCRLKLAFAMSQALVNKLAAAINSSLKFTLLYFKDDLLHAQKQTSWTKVSKS